jgi:hypothetical protein
LLCDPLETTANGKRLVVEDSAACQKTIQTPVAQQVLKTDGAGNLTWTNGASGTVLRKDATGLLEFATLNSVLQAGPVNLGSQPLTTTGTATVGSIISSGNIAINSSGDIVTSGSVTSKNLKTLGTGTDNNITFINTSNTVGMQGMRLAFDSDRMTVQRASDSGAFEANYISINQDNGNVGIGTTTPTNNLVVVGGIDAQHINVTNTSGAAYIEIGGVGNSFIDLKVPNSDDNDLRIGTSGNGGYLSTSGNTDITLSPGGNGNVVITNLKTYANNAAAVAGGLAVNTVYKTATGELRVVV